MTSPPPLIQGNILTYSESGLPVQLLVDNSDWYTWLETASTFTFQSEHGAFTARKERAGSKRGGEYWKAYSRRHGKLYRVYLGKSEDITHEQLHSVAVQLANKGTAIELLEALDLTGEGKQSSVASSKKKSPNTANNWNSIVIYNRSRETLACQFPGVTYNFDRSRTGDTGSL